MSPSTCCGDGNFCLLNKNQSSLSRFPDQQTSSAHLALQGVQTMIGNMTRPCYCVCLCLVQVIGCGLVSTLNNQAIFDCAAGDNVTIFVNTSGYNYSTESLLVMFGDVIIGLMMFPLNKFQTNHESWNTPDALSERRQLSSV